MKTNLFDLTNIMQLLSYEKTVYSTDTENHKRGDTLSFENEEARKRARRTVDHFRKRGFFGESI